MEVKILKEEKNTLDVELDSLTVAELMRVYVNKEGAKLAAWRREHTTSNPVLHIEADNPKKILKKAVAEVQKELEAIASEFKKIK